VSRSRTQLLPRIRWQVTTSAARRVQANGIHAWGEHGEGIGTVDTPDGLVLVWTNDASFELHFITRGRCYSCTVLEKPTDRGIAIVAGRLARDAVAGKFDSRRSRR
jgi:hypothetical protein